MPPNNLEGKSTRSMQQKLNEAAETLGNSEEENGGSSSNSPQHDALVKWSFRGVQWRVMLGVLPSSYQNVDGLRRVTATARRRYAEYRRRLLVDPHLMEEGQKPPDASMDNPLSLDPESIWGRYFRNAELERIIDKDLARLYPEHGSFFQSPSCQAMLRRILLVWSLIHPHCSYRQGMHELLAPLLYILHLDVMHFTRIRHRYEDLFDDRFDEETASQEVREAKLKAARLFPDGKLPALAGNECKKSTADKEGEDALGDIYQANSDIDVKVIVMGSDMYGAEGELGALVSSRFLEHDAYCSFDALMTGEGGVVAMADYFMVTGPGSALGFPPVLEACAALYRTLAAADVSLYTHLVELGVEPQYFALRWLRLLFSREFVLEDLLLVWDAIFSASNAALYLEGSNDDKSNGSLSSRSALISALAVSMLHYVRAALLAAPDATGCLQRLLNFPQIQDVRKLIENAKLLQPLAEAAGRTLPHSVSKGARHMEHARQSRTGSTSPPANQKSVANSKGSAIRHQASASSSPELLKLTLPGSYWEEKWKSSMLQKATFDEVLGGQSNGTIGKKAKHYGIKDKGLVVHQTSSSNSEASINIDNAAGAKVCNPNEADNTILKSTNVSNLSGDDVGTVYGKGITEESRSPEHGETPSTVTDYVANGSEPSKTADLSQSTLLISSDNEQSNLPIQNRSENYRDPCADLDQVNDLSRSDPVNALSGGFVPVEEYKYPLYADPLEIGLFQDVKDSTTRKLLGHDHQNASPSRVQEITGVVSNISEPVANLKCGESPRKIKTAPLALQALGQSMLDHIQVLESVLTQKVREGSTWNAPKDRAGQPPKSVLGGKGQVAALVALAELRKISNALLQM